MGFTSTTVKYILFFFNFVIAVCGAAIVFVAVSVWRSGQNSYTDITKEDITTPCIIFAVAGAVVFIIAFLGCCGAIQESHCMLVLYAMALLIIIIVEALVVGLAYYKKTNIEDVLNKAMDDTWKTYGSNTENTKSIDAMQESFQCCGTTGPSFYDSIGVKTPNSCYPNGNNSLPVNSRGCISEFTNFIKANLQKVMHVAIGVGVAEIIAVVFGLYYASHIRRYSQRGYA